MNGFHKFPSIEKMSDVVKLARIQNISGEMQYTAKIKLHGTNAAVRITKDGTFFQKRSQDVTPAYDNAGFSTWASSVEWKRPEGMDILINGEWAGNGINSKDAVTQLKEKRFFVFNVVDLNSNLVMQNPEEIVKFVPCHDRIHVLPRFSSFVMNFGSNSSLEKTSEILNSCVEEIGKIDPYIQGTFCINAPGEGLVCSPYQHDWMSWQLYRDFTFKVKTAAHSVQKTAKAASVDVYVPESVLEFVDMFVTDARVEQIVQENWPDGPSAKDTGLFLKAFNADVIKESKNEMEAAGLSWKDVSKYVTKVALPLFMKRT